MSTTETTKRFNFKDSVNSYFTHAIDTNIKLHIQQVNYDCIGQLYFTDNEDNLIPTPNKLNIYKLPSVFDDSGTSNIVYPLHNVYSLFHNESYTVYYDSIMVLELNPQMSWLININRSHPNIVK